MNPKNKKNIALCVSQECSLNGKDLRSTIKQMFEFFNTIVNKISESQDEVLAEDLGNTLSKFDLKKWDSLKEEL